MTEDTQQGKKGKGRSVALSQGQNEPGLKWLRFAVWLMQYNCNCMNTYEKTVSDNVHFNVRTHMPT